jgi:hypothetical protein
MASNAYDERLDRFVGFFSTDALAPYHQQPDKFTVLSDFFEGTISVTSAYFERLEAEGLTDQYITIRFGYRSTRDGELMLAVWLPDLVDKSAMHLPRWRGFIAPQDTNWLPYDEDTRFSLWVRRYVEGDWDVENGPAFQLKEQLTLVNSMALERVGAKLFDIDDPHISYPSAQNTHRYEDAHRDLYGVLLDGLNKRCVERLAHAVGTTVNCASERSLNCLVKVFPELKTPKFSAPFDNVSEQRRRGTHKVRPPARPMKAFETFSDDLQYCLNAIALLATVLKNRLDQDAKRS